MHINLSVLLSGSQGSASLAGALQATGLQAAGNSAGAQSSGFISELAGAAQAQESKLFVSVATAELAPQIVTQLRQLLQGSGGKSLPLSGEPLPPAGLMATAQGASQPGADQDASGVADIRIPLEQFLTELEAVSPALAEQLLGAAQLVSEGGEWPVHGAGPGADVASQVALIPASPTTHSSAAVLLPLAPEASLAVDPSLFPESSAAVQASAQPQPALLADEGLALSTAVPAGAGISIGGQGGESEPSGTGASASVAALAISAPEQLASAAQSVAAVVGERIASANAVAQDSAVSSRAALSSPTAQAASPIVAPPLSPLGDEAKAGQPQLVVDGLRNQQSLDLVQSGDPGRVAAFKAMLESSAGEAVLPRPNAQVSLAENSALRMPSQPVFQLPLELPVNNNHWGDQLAGRLRWLAAHQLRVADLQLNPAELGPLRVRVEHSGEAASVTFTVQHTATRELLEANLPRLRELFSAQGMELLDVDVSGESLTGRGEEFSGQTGQSGAGGNASMPVNAEAAEAQPGELQTVQLHYGLINTFA